MRTGRHTAGLALPAAMLLALALAGTTLGATVLVGSDAVDTEDPPAVETALTWEDLDGDGIDDDCDDEVVPDPVAVAASDAAADADGDGVVSVDEAARTDRIGGPDCNHGGYVDGVAALLGEADEDEEAEEVDEPEDEAPVEPCEADEVPVFDPVIFNGPGAFGAYVSSVAASDVVGGANCNHGGAVSQAVKAAREAARDARDAERAERAAERAAAKAERDAAKAERAAQRAAERAERAAERAAANAERAAGKANGKAGKGNGKAGQ